MKNYINVLCVLILALMLIDIVVDLFFTSSSGVVITADLSSYSLGALLFLLFISLLTMCSVIACFVYFIKFILNVNRNEVFTQKNISLLRKYGACALLIGVCVIVINIAMEFSTNEVVSNSIDALGEGLFALLMGEVFGVGRRLKEGKN